MVFRSLTLWLSVLLFVFSVLKNLRSCTVESERRFGFVGFGHLLCRVLFASANNGKEIKSSLDDLNV